MGNTFQCFIQRGYIEHYWSCHFWGLHDVLSKLGQRSDAAGQLISRLSRDLLELSDWLAKSDGACSDDEILIRNGVIEALVDKFEVPKKSEIKEICDVAEWCHGCDNNKDN